MNLGTALAGYGQAQPQLQQMQAMQQQKAQQAAQAKAMQQYSAQQQQQGQQPKLPDPMQMMDMLSKSGLPEDQQYQAWQQYSKAINPIDKLQNQFDLGMQKIDSARTRLEDQQGFLMKLQGMKDSTSRANTQDRVGAEDRGQDMRADTAGEALDFRKSSLKEKNDLITRGQDKQYQAKMAALAAKGTPEQAEEFKAAQTEFTQASADYRNAKMSLNSTSADIQAQADKAVAAQQKMEQAAAKAQKREPAKPVDIQRDSATGAPDPAQLSDKEQKSFDGGKTWWHLENGKPVKSE